jgi:hypothetical protein
MPFSNNPRLSKVPLTSAALVVAVCCFSPALAQSLQKQGNFEATFEGVGSVVHSVELSSGQTVDVYEDTLLFPNNPEGSLFHNLSASCVEVGFSSGPLNGYCVLTDKDGDKILEPIAREAGTKKGHATLGPGTGKYKGIQGKLDWEPITFLPAATGSYNFVGKKTGSYRIP